MLRMTSSGRVCSFKRQAPYLFVAKSGLILVIVAMGIVKPATVHLDSHPIQQHALTIFQIYFAPT
jgi:hypothetical protein